MALRFIHLPSTSRASLGESRGQLQLYEIGKTVGSPLPANVSPSGNTITAAPSDSKDCQHQCYMPESHIHAKAASYGY